MNIVKKIALTAAVIVSMVGNTSYAHGGMGCCGEGIVADPVTAAATGSAEVPLGVGAVKQALIGQISTRKALALLVVGGPVITWWNVTGAEYISKAVAYARAYYYNEPAAKQAKKCCAHEHSAYSKSAH